MNQRTERILENWLANTVRHCRATRLFDLNVHHLNRDEQIGLANACLNYFEEEAERLLKRNGGSTGEFRLPSSPKDGEDGSAYRARPSSRRGR